MAMVIVLHAKVRGKDVKRAKALVNVIHVTDLEIVKNVMALVVVIIVIMAKLLVAHAEVLALAELVMEQAGIIIFNALIVEVQRSVIGVAEQVK